MTAAPNTLTPELLKQLEQLKDIHLPEAVSWWPLAPGWWALAALIVATGVVAIAARYARRRSVRYRALAELNQIRGDASLQGAGAAERIAVLIKRIALQKRETKRLGVEHGRSWIEYLTHDPGGMSDDIASFIAMAPYANANATQTRASPDRASLFAAADTWIRRNA